MSRVAKQPVIIPSGVAVTVSDTGVSVKGKKGELKHVLHNLVSMQASDDAQGNKVYNFEPKDSSVEAHAITGTTRNVVNNMVTGVTDGFTKTLLIEGVGYRAQVKGNVVHLTLGFSHPIEYKLPEGVTVEAPSQTELIVQGIDKQLVGQVAAEIRDFRKPDPYKNKGVRYKGERLIRKESKSKK